MPTFNRKLYINEMQALVSQAKENLRAKDPQIIIYTISLWTDVSAAVSAVNFDTFEHSTSHMEELNTWLRSRQEASVSRGDMKMAAIFASASGRNATPADFAFTRIAECIHSAFADSWSNKSEEQRWDLLEPALLEVGELARHWFADVRLHPGTELSVNSSRDWCEYTWDIGQSNNVT